ncbi:MAG: 2-C-methyl-D-erythritol 4-phosphate cytidylyltransferase [Promicromonosporaceae bacterium]|nr:2-C-methyl-D-erythritol 4-phosphate cytidylyltransferase [Promicromonosporaceae bacterium]
MSTTAILTAAGSGERLGADCPKALVALGGVPMFVQAARRLAASGVVDSLIITCPPGYAALFAEALTGAAALPLPVQLVDGGATRQASVAAALAVLPAACDTVLVHDAARPFASPELVAAVVAGVRAGAPAVIPGLPVADTVKEVDGDGVVLRTVPRAALRTVQTPQGFARAALERAHAAAGPEGPAGPVDSATGAAEGPAATDDAALLESLGLPVIVIAGEASAMKITTQWDYAVAMAMLGDAG